MTRARVRDSFHSKATCGLFTQQHVKLSLPAMTYSFIRATQCKQRQMGEHALLWLMARLSSYGQIARSSFVTTPVRKAESDQMFTLWSIAVRCWCAHWSRVKAPRM